MFPRKLPPARLATTTVLATVAAAVALYATMGQSYKTLAPGYAQHLYGVSSLKSSTGVLSGVVVLQTGEVITTECRSTSTRLHIFDPSSTTKKTGETIVHTETVTGSIVGGCGITYLNVGGQDYIFSNINDSSSSDGDGAFGVSRIAWPSLATTKMAPGFPGNALGIAVDPQTNDLIYA